MKRLAVAAALVAAFLAGTAHAATSDPRLDKLSTTFAMRPSSIVCHTVAEDNILSYAWGYTYLDWDHAVVDQTLCDAVTAMLDGRPFDDWEAAVGVATITHESFHVRKWYLRGSEAAVECKAIRHFKSAARILGVPEETIARLWPWALYEHYRIGVLAPAYASPNCQIPTPWD